MLKLSPAPILWWHIRRRSITDNRVFLKEHPFQKINKILKKQKTRHTEAKDASMTGIILLITCLSSICRRLHNSLSLCSFFGKRHNSLPLEKEAVLFSHVQSPLEITELVISRTLEENVPISPVSRIYYIDWHCIILSNIQNVFLLPLTRRVMLS